MKTNIFSRIGAFLIDYIIVSLILSIITIGVKVPSDLNERTNNLLNAFQNEEITIEEYNKEVQELNYELQKVSLPSNIISLVITIGYFFIFSYLNKGQTLGKKLFKLKVVEKEERPSIKAILLRGLFIYGIISGLYNVIFINFLDVEKFSYGYVAITYIESIFTIVCFFMVLYRKDRRGLHDMMAGTNVVGEVK